MKKIAFGLMAALLVACGQQTLDSNGNASPRSLGIQMGVAKAPVSLGTMADPRRGAEAPGLAALAKDVR